uniref:Uncharacterized protein n=1 Tax=Anopheles albimanus TaxID=7167 RepID=A0A182FXY7_ANOAL
MDTSYPIDGLIFWLRFSCLIGALLCCVCYCCSKRPDNDMEATHNAITSTTHRTINAGQIQFPDAALTLEHPSSAAAYPVVPLPYPTSHYHTNSNPFLLLTPPSALNQSDGTEGMLSPNIASMDNPPS